MDANLKSKWVEALRSGQYEQTAEQLVCGGAYCCLGVLCIVAGYDIGDSDTSYRKLDGLLGNYGPFIDLNDNQGKTFAEIADFIQTANFPLQNDRRPVSQGE